MSPTSHSNDSETTVPVRRGKVDSVDLFEVKEHELEILENGVSNSNSSLFLNFSIFLISTAASSTLSLMTTSSFTKPVYETLILIITVVGYLLGIFLLLLWWSSHKKEKLHVGKVIKIIKDRIECSVVSVRTVETTETTITTAKETTENTQNPITPKS